MHYYWPILASKLLILTTTMLAQQHVFAQGRCVIVDKETGTPIRDVKAYTDKEEEFTTDYRGVLVIDKPFDSATLAHPKFLSRKVDKTELKDTVWLLPKAIRLDEVVVWGVKRSPMDAMMGSNRRNSRLKQPCTHQSLASISSKCSERNPSTRRQGRKTRNC